MNEWTMLALLEEEKTIGVMNQRINEPGVTPDVSLKEGYWVRIGDESYPVHKVRSVASPKSTLKPFFAEIDESTYESFWGFIGIGFGGFIVGAISCIWLGPAGLTLSAILAVLFWFLAIRGDLKARGEQRRNPLVDVYIALEKDGGSIQVAKRIPEAEGERIRHEIEEIVAAAAHAEAKRDLTKK